LQLHIKLIGGRTITVAHLTTLDTIVTVMARIYDKEGLREGKLMFQGKELGAEQRLIDCGIKTTGTTLHHVVKTRGSGAPGVPKIASFQFPDVKKLEKATEVPVTNFAPDAPAYRRCKPGLFAMSMCQKPDCKVHNDWFVHNFGQGTWNVAMCMNEVDCPVCHTIISADTNLRWAVNLCEWKFKGYTDKREKVLSQDWIRAPQGGFYLFDDKDPKTFVAMEITTRALPTAK